MKVFCAKMPDIIKRTTIGEREMSKNEDCLLDIRGRGNNDLSKRTIGKKAI